MQDNTDKNKSVAYKMLAIETVITCVVAIIVVLGANIGLALSVVIGGLAFIIPNAYFAKYVFRHSAADSPQIAIRWFYVGEVIKIFATVLIFTFSFLMFDQLNVPALILTYVSMLILNLLGNSILMSNPVTTAGKTDNNNGD